MTSLSTASAPPFPRASVGSALSDHARSHPDSVAVAQKRFGRWIDISWADLRRMVAETADELASHGVAAGTVVALIADNCVEWLVVDFALQERGATVLPVLPGTRPSVLSALLRQHGVDLAVCGDQEHIDLLLSAEHSATLRGFLVLDTVGLSRPLDPRQLSDVPLVTVERRSPRAQAGMDGPDRADGATGRGERIAAIDLTSVTQERVGVEVKAGRLRAGAERAASYLGLSSSDRVMCLDSMADTVVRSATAYAAVLSRARLHFAETVGSVAHDLAEIRPTVLVGSEDAIYTLRSESRMRQLRSGRMRRAVIDKALSSSARRHGEWSARLSALPTRLLVIGPLARHHGLSRVRKVVALGGMPLGAETSNFFRATCEQPSRVWGDAAAGGVLLADEGLGWRPVTGVDLEPVGDGRCRIVTGNDSFEYACVAMVDDGSVVLVPPHGVHDMTELGAVVSLVALSERVAGLDLVRRILFDPQAGHAQALVAYVELDLGWAAWWTSNRGLDFASQRELAQIPAVVEKIRIQLDQVAATVDDGWSIDRIVIAQAPWSVASGTLTPARRIDVAAVRRSMQA
ncbi:AMP-binding protein [Nocardioides humi]|uniref:AMP-dependent synthetase/ligase domain-containing protein n=1 Tax=Nocardioides humi TaxID=449461 RepID=A0ABN2AEH2_9ACTN|nr:AMP-binding protein [Nocardioides humi]